MRNTLFILFFVFLAGCRATIPSEAISNSAIHELKTISSELKQIEAQIPNECKNAFLKGLNPIYERIDIVQGQVKNISLSCQTEKAVLEQQISKLEWIIVFLIALIIFYIVLKTKKSLKIGE